MCISSIVPLRPFVIKVNLSRTLDLLSSSPQLACGKQNKNTMTTISPELRLENCSRRLCWWKGGGRCAVIQEANKLVKMVGTPVAEAPCECARFLSANVEPDVGHAGPTNEMTDQPRCGSDGGKVGIVSQLTRVSIQSRSICAGRCAVARSA